MEADGDQWHCMKLLHRRYWKHFFADEVNDLSFMQHVVGDTAEESYFEDGGHNYGWKNMGLDEEGAVYYTNETLAAPSFLRYGSINFQHCKTVSASPSKIASWKLS